MSPFLLSQSREKKENSGHMAGTMLGTFYNLLIYFPNIPQERYYPQAIKEDSEALAA